MPLRSKRFILKKHPKALENYGGDILLAGINYDRAVPAEKRKHTCKIEKYTV